MTPSRSRALLFLALFALSSASHARPKIVSTPRELFVAQSYGAHVIGDLTGNGLKDVAFLTQLGEGGERGVLSLFTQDRRREFSQIKRYQTPAGSREAHIRDVDGDGVNELLVLHEAGIARMNLAAGGQLEREIEELRFDWPEELGPFVFLSASWLQINKGEPPMLAMPGIGVIGLFRWTGEKYEYHAHLRTKASAFNFSLNMGTMASRLSSYQRDDASLGAAVEARRFVLLLPAIYLSDIDGDGDQDLAICAPTRARLSVHLNPGDGKFAEIADKEIDCASVTPEEALTGWVSERVSLVDFNGDGLPDIFSVKRGTKESREVVRRAIYLASAPLEYPKEANGGEFRVESIASQTVLRDFNGDGLLDIAFTVARLNISSLLSTGLTGNFRYVVRFHEQKPDKTFDVRPTNTINFSCDMSSLRETNGPYYQFDYDLTGDGVNDLAIVNDLENLEIYAGEKSGVFERSPAATLSVKRGLISFFDDLDNDSVPDFINLRQEQTARDFRLSIDFMDRK